MADGRTRLDASSSEFWIAMVFWGVILAGAATWYFHENHADVLLDVATEGGLVGGRVHFEGAPVRGGVVRLEVTESETKHYRGGTTLIVGADGTFSSQGQPLGISNDKPKLRVVAVFHGTHGEKDKRLVGETTVYLNLPPPLGERFLQGLVVAVVLVLAIQLILFTGGLGPRKARWLFILMYFFTFFSIAAPIAVSLIVAQNKYLVDAMEASPIGLVKAKTRVLTEPQWLINIGGTVVRERVSATVTRTLPERPEEPPAKPEPAAAPVADGDTLASMSANTGQLSRIEGGIAVPFFVVLLAMFGAGINMTLKVPDIQRSYEDVLPETSFASPWFNPLAATWRVFTRSPSTEPAAQMPHKTAGDIRRELIENYMYLISAPLLAIAVYYLLQVLAAQVTQPVLVIMAIATGLVSKAVIGGIIDFAESRLLSERRRGSAAAAPLDADLAARLAEARARQTEAEAAIQAHNEARTRYAAADAVAREAAEAARKAKDKEAVVQGAIGTGQATAAEGEVAKKAADEALRMAGEKQTMADEAAQELERAALTANAKRSEAETATGEAQAAAAKHAAARAEATASAAREAEAKQSAARVAAEATEEAAKAATEKQAEAQAAVQAVVQAPLAAPQDGKPQQEVTDATAPPSRPKDG